jgi:deoxyribodipyrimidine photo-lyase
VPVFIWAPDEEGGWPPGAASRWWLHHSLASLDASLRDRGSRLVLRRGPSLDSLLRIADETGAEAVFWNRRTEPFAVERDRRVAARLRKAGLPVATFNSSLLFEPESVATTSRGPFQVFTPFWRACLSRPEPEPPAPPPRTIPSPRRWPASARLGELSLEPSRAWADGLRSSWTPGETGAASRLHEALAGVLSSYPEERDITGRAGTSRLSPHLHFGEIGPRQVWHAVQRWAAASTTRGAHRAAQIFLRQLGWREFAHHLLFHFPRTATHPLRSKFEAFPWRSDRGELRAWQEGRTGVPIVDAAMRELRATGWMHNRGRMIAASFLVKDLLLSWRAGARWFWDTLVDADLANNTLGWQWVAGCGADAAPYFRVFNPVLQGMRFDPDGRYVSRWVPELAHLPSTWIHRPLEAPASVLSEAGIRLGRNYPRPLVDHSFARARALGALASIRKKPISARPRA